MIIAVTFMSLVLVWCIYGTIQSKQSISCQDLCLEEGFNEFYMDFKDVFATEGTCYCNQVDYGTKIYDTFEDKE
jgi:hypothetical protein